MKNILNCLLICITTALAGCSSWSDFSFTHSPDIQQGNIVTPEMVAALEPGMSQRQVKFVLGNPMLTDIFHPQRWDYLYSMKQRNQAIDLKQFTVYFDANGLMSRYEGDIEPAQNLESAQEKQEILIEVPDYQKEQGLFGRLFSSD